MFAVQLVGYELRVMSLEAGSLGEVLMARSIATASCLTCVQVSPTGDHVLLAYGRRSRELACLVPAQEGSFEVWHTVLQVRGCGDHRLCVLSAAGLTDLLRDASTLSFWVGKFRMKGARTAGS